MIRFLTSRWAAVALVAVFLTSLTAGSATADNGRVPRGFTESKAHVNGITVNYVRGGSGPTLVLLHGYPETWYEWRELLPELGRRFTVVAPDLRGAGGSSAPAGGYDKATMARDVHALLDRLGLDRGVSVVGHDIGTMVAYSYAAQYRADVRRLVLSEAPIPDKTVYSYPSLTANGPGVWNFGFFSLDNGLPEAMVAGREKTWIRLFSRSIAVHKDRASRPDAVAEYARGISDPAHLRASFSWFRAFPRDIADNKRQARRPLTMPVMAIGADGSLGRAVPDQVRRYATSVKGVVIADSGHWIYEEHPHRLTRLLLDFLDPR